MGLIDLRARKACFELHISPIAFKHASLLKNKCLLTILISHSLVFINYITILN